MITPCFTRSATARPPLRVAVLLGGTTMPRFAATILEDIARSNFAKVELEVRPIPSRPGVRALARELHALAWHLYERVDRAVAGATDPLAPVGPGPWLDGVERLEVPAGLDGELRFPDTALAELERHDLDVMLCLGAAVPGGPVRRAARHGLWAYRFGADRFAPGGPPFFHDMAASAPILEVQLELVGDTPGADLVLCGSTFSRLSSPFVAKQRQIALWETTHFVLWKLHDLHERGWDHVRSQARPSVASAPALAGAPGPVEVARVVVPRVATSVARRLLGTGARGANVWRVGLRRGAPPLGGGPGPASLEGFRWLDAPPGRYWADPFLFEHRGARFLFVEDFDLSRRFAGISRVEVFADGGVGPAVRCLDPGFHLSFPLVFEHGGEHFMVPESQSNGTVTLYRARRFPDEWVQEKVLFRGNAVDTVVWPQDGRFYFFTTLFERDDRGMKTMLFVADSLTGAWRVHPANPVSSDVRSARAAGRLFRRDGRLLRPAQNCGPRYGYGLVFHEVVTLSEDAYAERPLLAIEPAEVEPRAIGVHTYGACGDLEVVDIAVAASHAFARWQPPRAHAVASTGGLVSVIVPTYNRAHCIRRAIDSALGQTHTDVDVIVIDDGSSDDTRAVVLDHYGKDGRVRYVRQDNGGVSSARNHGIRLVKGEYAALLDSDDVWKPFKLELQLACLRAFPDAGMVWTDMTAVSPEGAVIGEHYLRRFYSGYRRFGPDDLFDRSLPLAEIAPGLAAEVGAQRAWAGDIYSQMVLGNLVHTSTVLLRGERLAHAGLFNEQRRSGEDHEFHLNTCRAGRVAFADLDTTLYLVGGADQLTSPRYALELATNYLDTMMTALARDRERIRLPQARIDEAVADAHRWVGEALLALGRRREARPHLLDSLRHQPGQPRLYGLYAAALLPPSVEERVRGAYRALRRAPKRTA